MQRVLESLDTQSAANDRFEAILQVRTGNPLVNVTLGPGEQTGAEVHDVDQFIRVQEGDGEVIMGGNRLPVHPESAFVVPAGMEHNVINTGRSRMRLYTIDSPPERAAQTAPADADNER